MIFVYTSDYRRFQDFLQEFHLREDFAGCQGPTCSHEGCKRGQVRYLYNADRLRGHRHAMVLVWGNPPTTAYYWEIEAICRMYDMPFIHVPDLKRARAMQERPELFRQW